MELCLSQVLSNWDEVEVRTVPNVMYQVVCPTNNTGEDIEYRFHWFLDCSETYIHNHRYAFDTYCLQGEYEERLWEISDGHSGTLSYKFPRTSGNKFGTHIPVPGVLRSVKQNHHFPGNTLHVEPNQYHSIVPIGGANSNVLTFDARRLCSTATEPTFVLSASDSIQAPTDEIRPATAQERQLVHEKLISLS
ncbi:unnamed protein product [Adineta ricciae]|uniref:Uncharacterized protein n=1 Tax=Adineta ricciae TaxID=249248 RepID=A0A815CMB2_ADIRI|nr:unnamed protein product [Adineta ricciae]CAF1287085.1 unnamed protein product [Adineta ricciae]